MMHIIKKKNVNMKKIDQKYETNNHVPAKTANF